MKIEDYLSIAVERFGSDSNNWKFICPSCGHVVSVAEYREAGAPEGAIAFSCVGRWTGATQEAFLKTGGPCNYSGGGLICINPVEIDGRGKFFEIAPA